MILSWHRMIPWPRSQNENACIQLVNTCKSQYNDTFKRHETHVARQKR